MDRNSKNQGFTQIPNHIFKNANWVERKFDDRLALIDLYSLAQFKDGYVIKKGKTIILKSGQIGWSQKSLAERWKWSIGKVKRFLKNMQTVGEIDIVATNVSTTITLLHWVQNGGANERAYEQANGNQIDRQTETKRYPNNIDNTVNTENTPIQGGGVLELFKMWLGDDYDDKGPTSGEITILKNALHYQPMEEWKPFLEQRLELKNSMKSYPYSMKAFFSGGYREMKAMVEKSKDITERFEKYKSGAYKACCSKCGHSEMPSNRLQLLKGSECCGVHYIPE